MIAMPTMAAPTCLLAGKSIPDPAADLKGARRIEQYRLGDRALYIPAGLRWNYLPLSVVRSAGESHRTVSAGHCVTVRERLPALEIVTDSGSMELGLEKAASLPVLLEALGKKD